MSKILNGLLLVCFFLKSESGICSKLSVGMLGEFRHSHPLLQVTEANSIANSFVLLPLVSLEKGWVWQCRLCTKLPTQANKGLEVFTDKTGIQKLAIHLEVPGNARWGDGASVGLKDIAFTWQVIQHLPANARTPNLLQEIEDIIIRPQETRHFTILLRTVTDPYPILNAFYVLSEHVDQAFVDKDKTWTQYFTNSLYVKDPKNPALYDGPFLVHSESENSFVLNRNPSALFPPKLDTLELQFFPTLSGLTHALTQGKVEMAVELSVWSDVLALLETLKGSGKQFQMLSNDGLYYEHLDFNLQNPIFQDEDVRKALAFAIDKEVILEKITQGWTIPAVSPIHPGDPNFSEKISLYDFSPQKARKILAESDWQIGPDGFCTKKNRTLSFEILSIDDPLRTKIANYLVHAWKAIGAQVTVKTLPVHEFREKIARRHFSGLALYSWKQILFQNTRSLYHSAAIPSLNNHYSGQNIPGWINTRVEASLSKFANTLNPSDRKHQMEFFQQEYTKELPGIPLFFRTQLSLLPQKLASFSLPPSPAGIGLTASEWHFVD